MNDLNLIKNRMEVLDEQIKLEKAYIKKTDNIPSYCCTRHKERLKKAEKEWEALAAIL